MNKISSYLFQNLAFFFSFERKKTKFMTQVLQQAPERFGHQQFILPEKDKVQSVTLLGVFNRFHLVQVLCLDKNAFQKHFSVFTTACIGDINLIPDGFLKDIKRDRDLVGSLSLNHSC